ncbi:MAG: UDP-N-acetylmuramate dehydrogenase, partial [Flavobacteriales bacterium]|nr:UDP-N-acetylmuramate dehydrogenase [Flavobacteriales bacterium]
MQLIPHADLTPYNTFGVPARARWLGRFHDAATLRDLLARPELRTAPHMVLGGGSNVLFAGDHPGAVLLNEVPGIHLVHEDDHHVLVRAGAGVYWHDLVMHAVAQGWGGIENMSLIPGKVGAAPMQNIGAYGVEVKDVLHALEALRIADGEVVGFTRADCAFGYRESFFKRAGHGRFVIMGVTLRLHKAPHTVSTNYGSINDELARRGITTPTIRDISDAVIAIRRSKLPEPKELGNAG